MYYFPAPLRDNVVPSPIYRQSDHAQATNAMTRRTQRQLTLDINQALTDIVREHGVAAISLREVAKRSQSDIEVLLRRFPTEEALVRYYIAQFDNFLPDTLKLEQAEGLSQLEQFKLMATQLEKALHHNKEMQEIMKWQLNVASKSTRQSASRRERTLAALGLERFTAPIDEERIHPRALIGILVAGMYYLTLRDERASFFGVDFYTKAGRALMIETMVGVVEAFLKHQEPKA